MRGIYTPVTKIRRQVFAHIAKFAYDGEDYDKIEQIPYEIIPGEVPTYRESVFKERAIIGERLRLAAGLPMRKPDEHCALSKGLEDMAVAKRIDYKDELVNVISFACMACPTKSYMVTDNCRGCLAHPCTSACPVMAVSIIGGKSYIDKEKCIKCGRCKKSCPYNAIISYDRPCAAACGVDAIESDHIDRAVINHEKCVSCGQCIVKCPFGAISDKSEIVQVITAIKQEKKVCAAIAPAFAGQFGPLATPDKIKEAFKKLGFYDVVEVALGADIGAVAEAHHFAQSVPEKQPFLATSCCPSWKDLAQKFFPTIKDYVSDSDTPMIETAKAIKSRDKDALVVFVGPCVAKKLEARKENVRGYVDFVLTFEEVMGMFTAKDVQFDEIEDKMPLADASVDGRGYAVAGGVASAIEHNIKEIYPKKEIKIDRADGLSECRKMLMLAKAGKKNGHLLEGMACPGGCIGGPGAIMPIDKAQIEVKKYKEQSPYDVAVKNPMV
ncbi:MAG: 4Fe-4S dicluster domain-containing protein [Oscillospiraceae bacterium]|nr:4Fe-4S dicluster domain-containing protein [Oscillospiraceae bacterium]